MTDRDKTIYIIAGPNGAGKTTFARELLPFEARCLTFINADLIAAGLAPFQPERAAVRAGRLMLELIDQRVAHGESFAFETTLPEEVLREPFLFGARRGTWSFFTFSPFRQWSRLSTGWRGASPKAVMQSKRRSFDEDSSPEGRTSSATTRKSWINGSCWTIRDQSPSLSSPEANLERPHQYQPRLSEAS